MVTKGNATVATIVLESAPLNCGNLALISAVSGIVYTVHPCMSGNPLAWLPAIVIPGNNGWTVSGF
jgi:hypothetical protein